MFAIYENRAYYPNKLLYFSCAKSGTGKELL